jgi:REP element-mobilizing transposase RayT
MKKRMDEGHKPNHNSYTLYYHVVFNTQKRLPLITREIADFLAQFFEEKSEELDVHLLEQGILTEHVHFILSLKPTHYIPETLAYLKGAASHEANHHHEFANMLYWMRGYHIDTVSAKSLDRAKAYVRDQYKRHPDRIPE